MTDTMATTGHAELTLHYDVLYFPLGAAAFGGAERSILELAAAQHAAGKRVAVCYGAALDATDFPAQAQALGIALMRIEWSPEQSLPQVAAAVWKLFSRVSADIVHFNMSWRPRMWCVPLIARLASRAKLVGSMRAMPEPLSSLPRGVYLGFIPGLRLWAWADFVIGRVWAHTLHATVSVNRDDYPPRLIREFGFSRRRLSVIYNGVRVPREAPSAAQRLAARRALGVDGGGLLVAYVGRVSPEKGIRYLIDALALTTLPVRLVVAGDGSDVEPMRARVRDQGLAERVRFLGYVSPADPVFTAADVVVVPSLWNEAFGRVVVEAMACGAVVIATAVGGMQEIFEHERQGILVPKADAAAIALALDRLSNDPNRLRELSEAGFVHARQLFSTERVAMQYGELYQALMR